MSDQQTEQSGLLYSVATAKRPRAKSQKKQKKRKKAPSTPTSTTSANDSDDDQPLMIRKATKLHDQDDEKENQDPNANFYQVRAAPKKITKILHELNLEEFVVDKKKNGRRQVLFYCDESESASSSSPNIDSDLLKNPLYIPGENPFSLKKSWRLETQETAFNVSQNAQMKSLFAAARSIIKSLRALVVIQFLALGRGYLKPITLGTTSEVGEAYSAFFVNINPFDIEFFINGDPHIKAVVPQNQLLKVSTDCTIHVAPNPGKKSGLLIFFVDASEEAPSKNKVVEKRADLVLSFMSLLCFIPFPPQTSFFPPNLSSFSPQTSFSHFPLFACFFRHFFCLFVISSFCRVNLVHLLK